MKRFYIVALGAALAAFLGSHSWSHGSQGGGGGGGGAGAGGAGGAGAAGSSGTAGGAGTAGAAGTGGTVGSQGAVGTSGTVGASPNRTGTAGSVGVPGNNATGVGANANAPRGQQGVDSQGSDFNGITQNPFFADPGVRSQLQLNDRQFNQLNTAYQRAFQRYNRSLNSPAERRQNAQQMRAARRGAATSPPTANRAGVPTNRTGTTNVAGRNTTGRATGNTAAGTSTRTGEAGATGSATGGATATNTPPIGTATNRNGELELNDNGLPPVAGPATGRNTTTATPGTTGTATGRNPTTAGTTGTATADGTQPPAGANPATDVDDRQHLTQQQQLLQDQFNTDFNTTLDSTFTDQAMRQRFNQLNTQFQGLAAFNNPAIQRQLNLTAQQRQQLAALNGQWSRDVMRRQGGSQNMTQAQFNDLRTQFMTRVNSVLTPEQQQAWAEIAGEPYDFPMTTYFPQTNSSTTNSADGGQTIAPRNRATQAPQTVPRTVR